MDTEWFNCHCDSVELKKAKNREEFKSLLWLKLHCFQDLYQQTRSTPSITSDPAPEDKMKH